jgi:uncharacterized glyoxalase superfamily protein PhnB
VQATRREDRTMQAPIKPPPADWPRASSSLFYQDAAAAIDWLCDAFGFTLRLRVEGEGGRIEHSELEFGGALVMAGQEVADGGGRAWKARMRSPRSLDGANTQCIMLFVDDADAHCAYARARGAVIVEEPATHDYGDDYWSDRSYGALDPEGHMWWITQRLRNPPG